MFELVEIAEKQNFHDRIFPIVLQDANIYKAVNRIKYIKYWEDQISELDSAMKTVSAANLQGITDDINLYTRIRATISGLANTLKDMNTLTAEIHEDSDFRQLIEALEKRTKTSLKTSKPEMTTNTGKWGRVFGKWTHIQDGSIYVGPEDPNTSHPYGILLSDTSMREGVIQVKIRFPQLHGAGRILFGYRSSTNPYFTVGIGGYGYAYVLDDFRPTVGWQAFKYSGIETDIIIGADYQIEVQVKESLIVLKSNGIEIIKGEPPRGIGLGQIGLFAWSTGKVEFRDFRTSFT
jgi:hypothetical protein